VYPTSNSGSLSDNTYDLGAGSARFKDLYLSGNISVGGTVDGVDIAAFKTAYDSHNHNTWDLPAFNSGFNIDTEHFDNFYGTTRGTETDDGTWPGSYYYGVNLGGGKSRGLQLASPFSSGNSIWYRAGTDNASSDNGANNWKNWRRIFDVDYHPNADKWTTARTLTLSGDASGSVSWDGSANATLSVSVGDADTVDGLQASSFLRSDADDTFSGNIQTTNTNGIRFGSANQTDANDGYIAAGKFASGLNIVGTQTTAGTGRQVRVWGSLITDGGNAYWHAGNDGSGSGLDADTVDGLQASSFLRSDANDTMTGTLTVDNELRIDNGNSTSTHLNYSNTSVNYIRGTSTIIDTPVTHNGTLTTDGLTVDGTTTLNGTLTLGANVINDVEDIYLRDKLFHDGDTDTYIGFATNTINFSAGGTTEMFINGSGVYLGNSALHEDYDALSGTSVTIDPNTGGAWSLTMTGNTTFTFGGTTSGYSVGLIVQLTGNGGTVTWPSSVDWAGGTAPDAPASGETDIYVFWTRDGGTTWYGVQSIDAAA